jgi:outer membrane protein OmpA-like peptidoglycan-associated protein
MPLFVLGTLIFAVCINLQAQVPSGPGRTTPTVAGAELPLSISILYFDQSSFQLRPGVKASLDSIARVLVSDPTRMAAVTGYTDSIGKRELNRVLAENRAKTIARYLHRRGVPAARILTSWEGPDSTVVASDPEAAKTISRRAVIQLYPK